MNFSEINNDLQDLKNEELIELEGGILPFLAAAAAVAGIVYLAGEIAESIGRRHGGCDPH